MSLLSATATVNGLMDSVPGLPGALPRTAATRGAASASSAANVSVGSQLRRTGRLLERTGGHT